MHTMAVSTRTPGSVTASMGPRATSAVDVLNRPDLAPASLASTR